MSEKEKIKSGNTRKLAAYLLLFAMLVAADQCTKLLAIQYLKGAAAIPIIEPLIGLSYVENSGAAWGMLSGQTLILTMLPVVSISVFIWYMLSTMDSGTEFLRCGIVAIVSGATGNLIDRLFRGGFVVDFLELRFISFPVFNIADLCVTAGAILLAIHLLFFEGRKNE